MVTSSGGHHRGPRGVDFVDKGAMAMIQPESYRVVANQLLVRCRAVATGGCDGWHAALQSVVGELNSLAAAGSVTPTVVEDVAHALLRIADNEERT